MANFPEIEYFMVKDPFPLFISVPTFTCWKNATPSPIGGYLVCVVVCAGVLCVSIQKEVARHPQQAKLSTQPPAGQILPEAGKRTFFLHTHSSPSTSHEYQRIKSS